MIDEGMATRGERTRELIIQAAHSLFVEQGYHGTSIRQIAQKAGIALGGLYNHFASKEEVFEAVFFTYHPYHDVLPVLLDYRGEDIEAFIQDAAYRAAEAIRNRSDFMNLMFIEIVEFKSAHIRELFVQIMPKILEFGESLIQPNTERLKPIPFPHLARSFIGLIFAYYMVEVLFADLKPPVFQDGGMNYLVDIYLHGILTDPSDRTASM